MKIEYSPARRAVVAAVCLDFGTSRETLAKTIERQIQSAFRPFSEDEKKSRRKPQRLFRAGAVENP